MTMRGFVRLITFLAAVGFAGLIVLYPRAIAEDMHGVDHGSLVLLLLGMSAAWVSGLGFEPRRRALRAFFNPVSAWVLMLLGAWLTFLA